MDLKSDKFPGCQIYIYINIQLLDELPKQKGPYDARTMASSSISHVSSALRGSIMGSFISDANTIEFDADANAFENKKRQLIAQVGQLQEERIKLDQEYERVSFQKD